MIGSSTLFLALSALLPLTLGKRSDFPHHTAIAKRAAEVEKRGVNVGWPYGSQKIRGVNLGGWLVLEPFITPTLFSNTGNDGIVDEWTFSQYQDRNTAQAALTNHWNTWITEDDFAQIAAAGLNHVRIPIGFWAYDISGGEPYIQGQAAYLDKAIGWARNHGIKVMIDLHGAPGSQNGYDNSGHRGGQAWDSSSSNVLRTKLVIQTLSQKYSDPSYWQVVTALALLNEPATYLSSNLLATTRQYWYDAYGAARYPWAPSGSASKSGLALVIHDGFQPLTSYNGFMTEPNFEDVLLDTHNYQVFNNQEVSYSYDQHIAGICARGGAYSQSPLWLVVGEWSLASTDCAKWLNGRGIGSRYDGSYSGSPYVGSCSGKSGSGSDFSGEYKTFLRKFWDVQTQTYENNGQGWIMWAWKMEAAAEWSYQAGLAGGWIPSDPSNHQYPVSSLCT